jgi:hypothetical protein
VCGSSPSPFRCATGWLRPSQSGWAPSLPPSYRNFLLASNGRSETATAYWPGTEYRAARRLRPGGRVEHSSLSAASSRLR